MDRTVDGDVQKDPYRERDEAVATHDLTINDQNTVGPRSEVQESLPPEAAANQVVVGDIPRQPLGFQSRPHLTAQLTRPGRGVSVLTGPQGAGKTQLAAACARAKMAEGWRLVAWVNAADSGNLAAGLVAVAGAVVLAGGSEQDSADAGVVVRRWLEADGDRCLLVFDDAEDPDALRPFVPADGAARVLITSVKQSTADLWTSIRVDGFSVDEAAAVLIGRTGLDDAAGAAAVAAALEYLPLAQALAAPVIAGQHHGYARYLNRLQAMSTYMSLAEDDEQRYAADVGRTVLLSLQAIRAADETGVSTRVMGIMAVLSAAGVRRELLHAAGQAGVLARDGSRVAVDPVDRVLEWLSDRSLLTFSLDGQTIILHRLVARVIRNELARTDTLTAVCAAAAFVLDVYSRALMGSPDRRARRGISQQVTALLDCTTGSVAAADRELALALLALGFIAFHHILELDECTSQALAAGELLTVDLERLLGPDDPDTPNSQNSLAAHPAAGRVAEAIPPAGQFWAARESRPHVGAPRPLLRACFRRPPADPARGVLPAGFHRPPADPSSGVLPAGFRRPPADSARQPLPDGVECRPRTPTDHSPTNWTQYPLPQDLECDHEIVAAITAGDPAGIEMACDRYAAAVYGYCYLMLHDSAAAAAALQDTFVVAVATLGELSEPARLRRWLFARARKECRRRIRTTSAIRDGETYPANQRPGADQRLGAMGQLTGAANESADATMSFRVISEPVAAANESADATISFRVISEPVAAANESADATMSFRVISKTDDLGHVNGDPGKPTLDPDLFRPRLAEAP